MTDHRQTLADSFSVAKLLDVDRGTRGKGFVDSSARKAERRIFPLILTQKVTSDVKKCVVHAFLANVSESRETRAAESNPDRMADAY